MYTLLVGGELGGDTEETFVVSGDRFLEYTSEAIAVQFRKLSVEARACLASWPCLRMEEGRGEETAFVGLVSGMSVDGPNISVTLRLLLSQPPLLNAVIWRERMALDIEQFEFSRHHWAIKNRSLFSPLEAAGHVFEPGVMAQFANLSLPVPPRSELLRARDLIANWSQTDIDDLLLEAGVQGLAVPRAFVSRRDRATAIVTFALDNPEAVTAENSLFSAFIVRAATDDQLPPQPVIHATPTIQAPSDRSPSSVFIVHGQNDEARSTVVSFLERHGLRAIVLHEQPNMGRHLLTKFIDEAELVTFAVVLMTDDDEGRLRGAELAPRARQNVILELGYFLSHLGQARVCALITPGLDTPSDFDGIVYIAMDDRGSWKSELTRELRAAGLPLREP